MSWNISHFHPLRYLQYCIFEKKPEISHALTLWDIYDTIRRIFKYLLVKHNCIDCLDFVDWAKLTLLTVMTVLTKLALLSRECVDPVNWAFSVSIVDQRYSSSIDQQVQPRWKWGAGNFVLVPPPRPATQKATLLWKLHYGICSGETDLKLMPWKPQ